MDISRGLSCPLCTEIALDPLGHHAATCKRGGDVIVRHNHLRDVFVELCHQAHLRVKVEEGSGLTPDMSRTRPADVLVQNWVGGKPAAFDFTVTSPLIPKTLGQSSIFALVLLPS